MSWLGAHWIQRAFLHCPLVHAKLTELLLNRFACLYWLKLGHSGNWKTNTKHGHNHPRPAGLSFHQVDICFPPCLQRLQPPTKVSNQGGWPFYACKHLQWHSRSAQKTGFVLIANKRPYGQLFYWCSVIGLPMLVWFTQRITPLYIRHTNYYSYLLVITKKKR